MPKTPTLKTKTAALKPIYQLKVTLAGTKPPIWRRLQVTGSVTLSKLAAIINTAMGWDGVHLYEFSVGSETWGPPAPAGEDWGDATNDDRKATLAELAPHRGSKLKYLYDMGDSWLHQLVVEQIVEPEPKQRYPLCVEGKRACPPEDCGGVAGFYNLLEVLADPKHPEHKELAEWVGGEFDPEAFKLDGVNQALRHKCDDARQYGHSR